MDDKTLHVHRCHCGVSWSCGKPDCQFEDECTDCERAVFEQFAEQHHWTALNQPVLPEVAHARVGARKDEDDAR